MTFSAADRVRLKWTRFRVSGISPIPANRFPPTRCCSSVFTVEEEKSFRNIESWIFQEGIIRCAYYARKRGFLT